MTTMNRRSGQHGAPGRSRRIIGTHTNHRTTRERTETPIPDLAEARRDPRLGLLELLLGLGHTKPTWTNRRRVHGSSGWGPTPADTPIPDLQPTPILLRGLVLKSSQQNRPKGVKPSTLVDPTDSCGMSTFEVAKRILKSVTEMMLDSWDRGV